MKSPKCVYFFIVIFLLSIIELPLYTIGSTGTRHKKNKGKHINAQYYKGHNLITNANKSLPTTINGTINIKEGWYDSLEIFNTGLSRDAFELGVKGFKYLIEMGKVQNEQVLTIIDYSIPSYLKRLFVFDPRTGELLFKSLVSHGKNSGMVKPNEFSNKINSEKSSLGFFITDNTYIGHHGYSLRLLGEESGINDNAYTRQIVIHSAEYVNENQAKQLGYVGRSFGCPALPVGLHKKIIEKIKNGSCLFLYASDRHYLEHSQILLNCSLKETNPLFIKDFIAAKPDSTDNILEIPLQ